MMCLYNYNLWVILLHTAIIALSGEQKKNSEKKGVKRGIVLLLLSPLSLSLSLSLSFSQLTLLVYTSYIKTVR